MIYDHPKTPLLQSNGERGFYFGQGNFSILYCLTFFIYGSLAHDSRIGMLKDRIFQQNLNL